MGSTPFPMPAFAVGALGVRKRYLTRMVEQR